VEDAVTQVDRHIVSHSKHPAYTTGRLGMMAATDAPLLGLHSLNGCLTISSINLASSGSGILAVQFKVHQIIFLSIRK
jgi:hypothetical protein